MVIKKNIEKVFPVGSKPKYKEKFSSQNKQNDGGEQSAILISSLSCELLKIFLSWMHYIDGSLTSSFWQHLKHHISNKNDKKKVYKLSHSENKK